MTEFAVLSVDAAVRTTADDLLDMLHAARPAWHTRAACRGQHAVMFPSESSSNAYAAASALCATCPVLEPCREAGRNEHHGMWGGVARGHVRARNELNVYTFLRRNGGWWATAAIARELEVGTRAVNRQIASLIRLKKVERRGTPGSNHDRLLYRATGPDR